ncbi:hypothetical protein EJB05_49611, partial [Eragrostis curvula]
MPATRKARLPLLPIQRRRCQERRTRSPLRRRTTARLPHLHIQRRTHPLLRRRLMERLPRLHIPWRIRPPLRRRTPTPPRAARSND